MKAIMQTLKMMLIAAIFCCSAISANAQGSFFLSGTVRLGNGLGVPNWTVNVVEITAPTNTYSDTTDLDGYFDIIIPNGSVFFGPNKRWQVSVYDSCSAVLRVDTVENFQGTVNSASVTLNLSQCQNNICDIGWQHVVNNQAVTFFSSAFGAPNGTTSYLWVFGDGTTSTDKNPTHFYQPGSYFVCAWVFSKSAANDYCIDYFCSNIVVDAISNPNPNCISFEEQVINNNDRENAFNLYGNGNAGFLDNWNVTNGTPSVYSNGFLSGVNAFDGSQYTLLSVCDIPNSSEGLSLIKSFEQGKTYEVTIAIRNFATNGNPTPLDIDFVLLKNQIAFTYQTQTGCTQTPPIPTDAISVKSITSFAQNSWQLVTFSISNLTSNYEHLWIRPKFSANAPLATTFFLFDNLCIEDITPQPCYSFEEQVISNNDREHAFNLYGNGNPGFLADWKVTNGTPSIYKNGDLSGVNAYDGNQYALSGVCGAVNSSEGLSLRRNFDQGKTYEVTIAIRNFGTGGTPIPIDVDFILLKNTIAFNYNSQTGCTATPAVPIDAITVKSITSFAQNSWQLVTFSITNLSDDYKHLWIRSKLSANSPLTTTLLLFDNLCIEEVILPTCYSFEEQAITLNDREHAFNLYGNGNPGFLADWKVTNGTPSVYRNGDLSGVNAYDGNQYVLSGVCGAANSSEGLSLRKIFEQGKSYEVTIAIRNVRTGGNPTPLDIDFILLKNSITYNYNSQTGCSTTPSVPSNAVTVKSITSFAQNSWQLVTFTITNLSDTYEHLWIRNKLSANAPLTTTFFLFDALCIEETIITCNALQPDFSHTSSGQVVNFTNLTQSAHPNDMLYTWKFGDGTTSNDKNPIHTYPAANSYNVCLIAKDLVNNCIDSICKQVVTSSAPATCNANFGILSSSPNTLTLVAPATVTFKDSSVSNTPGTGIAAWLWVFGDGITSTLQNPTHTYTQDRQYQVCLTITTTNGCTDSYCKQVIVLAPANCAIVFNALQTPNSNLVSFQSTTSANVNAQPVSYQWVFGDGSGSPTANPTHTYATTGNYYVCVQVAFTDGCTAQYCDSVLVNTSQNSCSANFQFINNGINTLTYELYDSSFTATPNDPVIEWEWQVNNNVKSTQQNFIYTFTNPGTYTVCLKITTLSGCTSTECKTISISNNVSCDANFTAAPYPGIANKIEFTNTSTSSTIAGTFYSWNFGDGSPVVQDLNTFHTYNQPGVYTVCLYLFNQNIQCYDTICKQVTVGNTNINCTASFIYTVNGSTVSFNNTSSPGLNTNSYFWTFGDSTTSTGLNPSHTYTASGTYQVCLTIISSSSNCTNSICKTIVIGQNTSLNCISGKVYKGTPNSIAYPARVVLIYHDDVQGTLTAIQYASTGVNGSYEFCNVPNGKYLVKAALTPNDPQYSNYLPTYYGNSLFWNFATSVTVTQNVQQIDIWLIAGNNQGGPGFVGGYVSQGANKIQAPGDALQDIQVMLLDMFDNPVQYILTDEDGRWRFSNVSFGTYQVYAEVAGKVTIPYIVTISEQQPSANNILLFVESEQVISSISEMQDILSLGLSIFPNPTSDRFYIETNLQQQANLNISLTDIAGKVIIQEVANFSAGNAKHGVNIANEKSGMYILKVEHNGFSKIFKLMKY